MVMLRIVSDVGIDLGTCEKKRKNMLNFFLDVEINVRLIFISKLKAILNFYYPSSSGYFKSIIIISSHLSSALNYQYSPFY